MYDSILVAVDGSEEGKKALKLACTLARQENAQLHILHVPEPLYYPTTMVWGIGPVMPMYDDRSELEAAAKKIIEGAAAHARELGVENVQAEVIQGDPARTIMTQAETLNVDTIVMGSRGLGNLSGFIMGSVSHKVSNSAKCGVIVVR